MIWGGFNTENGNGLHAILCPGSRGNTGPKMGFWSTSCGFSAFWKFCRWTLFQVILKPRFYALPHKALECPRFNRTTSVVLTFDSIPLFPVFCQITPPSMPRRVRWAVRMMDHMGCLERQGAVKDFISLRHSVYCIALDVLASIFPSAQAYTMPTALHQKRFRLLLKVPVPLPA